MIFSQRYENNINYSSGNQDSLSMQNNSNDENYKINENFEEKILSNNSNSKSRIETILEALENLKKRITEIENYCNKKDKKIVENFSNPNSYMEYIILILLGIIIIYVMDSILKIGKKIGSRS